ncbi:MAG: hypothetical protein JXM69_01255 [Anaerolineae bacterium]|nr:hypothetical protein [Anaerolineae bacterium]
MATDGKTGPRLNQEGNSLFLVDVFFLKEVYYWGILDAPCAMPKIGGRRFYLQKAG